MGYEPAELIKSLEIYDCIKEKYQKLNSRKREDIPESEFISFLLELKKNYPLMFSLEQRQNFREMSRNVGRWIDLTYRFDGKRASAFGCSAFNRGVFGEIRELKEGIVLNDNDKKCHDGKPVLCLNDMYAKIINCNLEMDNSHLYF